MIGTGSTGVQVLPAVAKIADHVTVFQRTPKFVLPAPNHRLTDDEIAAVKENYPALRAASRLGDYGTPFPPLQDDLRTMTADAREELLESYYETGRIGGFISSLQDHLGMKSREVNDYVSEFMRNKVRELVKDPETAEALIPYGYPMGINRIIVGEDFYESFNRDNVDLHSTIDDPIVEFTATTMRTAHHEFEVDDVIFATGYDGLTGSLTAVDIRSRSGPTIRERWVDGPCTYLGMQISDFPNLFVVTGPGGPSVLANVIVTIEQSVDFITALIKWARDQGASTIEVDAGSEAAWMDHVEEVSRQSLYAEAYKANAWYSGSNVPGKKVVFMPYAGGVGTFEALLEDVARDGYRGFRLSAPDDGERDFVTTNSKDVRGPQ